MSRVTIPALFLLSAHLYGAIIVNGTNTNVAIPGTDGLGAIAVGYNATNGAIPSTFSTNFLVKGDGTSSSSAITFSTAPYTIIDGDPYFIFVLDSQENTSGTGGRSLLINVVQLLVNNSPVWSTTDSILLNSVAPLTLTAQGNGADMALYVPLAAFNGLGLTGSSTFVFSATHSMSNNGSEEWEFTDRGISTPIRFAGPNEIISGDINNVNIIPEPSSFAMIILGAGLIALRASRRRE